MDERVIPGPAAGLLSGVAELLDQREGQYGSAHEVYGTVGKMWDAYLEPLSSGTLEPLDVLVMMALLKIGRIAHNHGSSDHYVDAIGYLALAHEDIHNTPKRNGVRSAD